MGQIAGPTADPGSVKGKQQGRRCERYAGGVIPDITGAHMRLCMVAKVALDLQMRSMICIV